MKTCLFACVHNAGRSQMADPKGQPVERVRDIRDEIDRRIAELARRDGLG